MKFNYLNERKSRFGLSNLGRGITGGLSVLSPKLSIYLGKKLLLTPHGKRRYDLNFISVTKELNLLTSMGLAHVNLFGKSHKLVILSHGWGDTSECFQQLISSLVKQGYMVAAIDHIGHGKSSGKMSHLSSFIESLELLTEQFLEEKVNIVAIIGHSMGAVATLNLPNYLLESKKIILISSPIKFFELMFEKVEKFGISRRLLSNVIENIADTYGKSTEQLSCESNRNKLSFDITFIHDRQDRYAPFDDVSDFIGKEKNTLIVTEGLGHRKILGDTRVIKHIAQVLSSDE